MTQKNSLSLRTAGLTTADSLDRYVAEISRYPLLTREQEFQLATQFHDTGDVETAHKLVTSNLRFVVKVAYEYKGYGLRLLDLIQEGNVGLMIAVKKFEPKRGYRLISYAVWWIRAYMQNFILRSWSLVKVGTTQAQRKLFYKLRGTEEALARLEAEGPGAEHGPVDSAEIAKALGVETSEVDEMKQRLSARDFSLDAELAEGGATHIDRMAAPGENQEELLARSERQHLLEGKVSAALEGLNEKERYIVENRLMAEEPLTLREIGEKFKISRERARQIEANVVKKVRKLLGPSSAAFAAA